MAEAFAAGDWQHALHPRTPPLHPLTSGIISFITGLDGFSSVKASSVFWFFAGMFVLYRLARLLFPDDRRVALWSIAMYAIFPYTVQMASYGLRESAKTFFLLLSALSLVRIRRNPSDIINYILAGLACGLGTLIRIDTFIVSIAVLASAAFIECSYRKVPWMSMFSGVIQSAMYLPSVIFNWYMFKAALPDWKFSYIFQKHCGRLPDIPDFVICSLIIAAVIFTGAWIMEKICRKIPLRYFFILAAVMLPVSSVYTIISCKIGLRQILKFCNALYEGIYTFVGIFILIMLIIMWKKKKITLYEKTVFAVWFFNAFLNIISIQLFEHNLYISSRYLHPAMPLLFCFFVCAVQEIYCHVRKYLGVRKSRIILGMTTVLIAAAMIFHIFQPVIRDFTRKKNISARQNITALAEMIKKDYRHTEKKRPAPGDPAVYYADRSPKIYFPYTNKISVAAFLAGGSLARGTADADYIISADRSFGRKNKQKLTSLGSINTYKGDVYYIWRCE